MRKIIPLVTSLFLSSACFASANHFMVFKTVDQFNQYCPAVNSLQFQAINAPVKNPKGTVSASKNSVRFTNDALESTYVTHPFSVVAGIIQQVSPRSVAGENNFGNMSGSQINCFYSYPTFIPNTNFHLILSSVSE